ncbi:MAG: Ig-like domain-containing protein [Candidatus Ozemobacteraceae bacterium]
MDSRAKACLYILLFFFVGFISINIGCSGSSGKSLVTEITGGDDTPLGPGTTPIALYDKSVDYKVDTRAVSLDNNMAINIASGSFDAKAKLTIFKYAATIASTTLPNDFAAVSELYNLTFLDETNKTPAGLRFSLGGLSLPIINYLTVPATITMRLATPREAGVEYFIAVSNEYKAWRLAPTTDLGTEFSTFASNINGNYMIVKRIANFTGALDKPMQLSLSRSQIVASASEVIERNVDISLSLATKDGISFNHSNSSLSINLFAKSDFSFLAGKPLADAASMTVSASVPDAAGVYSSNAIDLLDYAVLNASGNNATYTFTLNLRGKALSEVPSEIIFKANYKTTKGLTYSAENTLYFVQAQSATEIVSLTPTVGGTILPKGQEFTIKFNRDMDKAATSAGLSLFNTVASASTPLNNTYWSNSKTVTASASSLLAFNTPYKLIVSGALTADGVVREPAFEFPYTTATQTDDITMMTPQTLTEVATDTNIVLLFPRNMNTQTFVAENFELYEANDVTPKTVEVIESTVLAVTLKPSAPLDHNKIYSLKVLESVLDATGSPVKETTLPEFTTISQPEVFADTLTPATSTPIIGSTEFEITFSREMNETLIESSDAFTLTNTGTGSPVSCTFFWSNNSKTVRITPSSLLEAGATYRLSFKPGLKDIGNNSLIAASFDYTVSNLTQVNSIVATLAAPVNAAGTTVATNTKFLVTFNRNMGTVTASDIVLKNSSTGLNLACLAPVVNLNTVTVTPSAPMAYNTEYVFTIKSTAKDTEGMGIIESSLTVNTDSAPALIGHNITPSGNTVNKAIVINFSKAMDTTRTQGAFSLYPMSFQTKETKVSGAFAWSNENKTLTFTPYELLLFNKDYKLEITNAACDSYYNSMSSFIYDFITTTQTFAETTAKIEGSMQGVTRTVATSTSFICEFTRNLDPASLAGNVSLKNLGTPVAITIDSSVSKIIKITPHANLNFNTDYRVEINNSVKDYLGQPILTVSKDYRTDIRPTLTLTPEIWNNDNASLAIWPSDTLTFNFNKVMFNKEMNTAKTESGFTITPNPGYSFAWDPTGKIATLTINWVQGEMYTMTLNQATSQDIYGNTIETGFTKSIAIKSGATFSSLNLASVSDITCKGSCTIYPQNDAVFIESGVCWHPASAPSEISTFTNDVAGSFTNLSITGFEPDIYYKIYPYVIYNDSNEKPYIQLGGSVEFRTNPLAGGTDSPEVNYLVSTKDDPYFVSSPRHLITIGKHDRAPLNGHYRQTAAINMNHETLKYSEYDKTKGFDPIGSAALPFTGTYSGRDNEISGLYIDRFEEDNVGLFSCIDSAELSRIKIVNFLIRGNNNVGTLVGSVNSDNSALISSSSAILRDNFIDGGVYAKGNNVGGILGKGMQYTELKTLYYSGKIVADITLNVSNYGGIVGITNTGSLINNCYVLPKYGDSTANSSINTSGISFALDKLGGIVGYAKSTTVSSCTAYIDLNAGLDNQYAGGIVGQALNTTIRKCYVRGSAGAVYPGSIAGKFEGSSGLIAGCTANVFTSHRNTTEGEHPCFVYHTISATVNPFDDPTEPNICEYVGAHDCDFRSPP